MSAERITAQIRAGLAAFAAGDALGFPWEGRPPEEIGEGPPGPTSDDTAQLLLVAEALADADPARAFLERLAAEADTIRGMGPTSRAAVERFRLDGSLTAEGGATNGAAMRAPAIGWGARDPQDRGALVFAITRTTHGSLEALAAAETIALLADRLLRGADPAELAPTGWEPPAAGIGLGATETVQAVRHVLGGAGDVADAARRAVRLGGDTDTVAALAAGLLACHPDRAGDPIPWLGEMSEPPPEALDRAAATLAARRLSRA